MIYINLYSYICVLSTEDRFKIPNVTRYFDLIQNLVHEIKPKITFDLVAINLNAPPVPKKVNNYIYLFYKLIHFFKTIN